MSTNPYDFGLHFHNLSLTSRWKQCAINFSRSSWIHIQSSKNPTEPHWRQQDTSLNRGRGPVKQGLALPVQNYPQSPELEDSGYLGFTPQNQAVNSNYFSSSSSPNPYGWFPNNFYDRYAQPAYPYPVDSMGYFYGMPAPVYGQPQIQGEVPADFTAEHPTEFPTYPYTGMPFQLLQSNIGFQLLELSPSSLTWALSVSLIYPDPNQPHQLIAQFSTKDKTSLSDFQRPTTSLEQQTVERIAARLKNTVDRDTTGTRSHPPFRIRMDRLDINRIKSRNKRTG